MVEFSTILQFIQATGIIVGVGYYIMNIQNNQKNQELALKSQNQALETRQAQMFMQIYNVSHNDSSFLEAMSRCLELQINSYDEFMKIRENEEDKRAIGRIGMFLEGLGVLVREGYVSIRLVALLMTGTTRILWERIYRSWVEEGRERMNYRRYRSEAEYLYNELMKYIEKHPELAT